MSDSQDKIAKKIKRIKGTIVICQGSKCKKNGSQQLRKTAKELLKKHGLHRNIHICRSQCQGFCKAAPIAAIFPQGEYFTCTTPEALSDAIEKHFTDEK